MDRQEYSETREILVTTRIYQKFLLDTFLFIASWIILSLSLFLNFNLGINSINQYLAILSIFFSLGTIATLITEYILSIEFVKSLINKLDNFYNQKTKKLGVFDSKLIWGLGKTSLTLFFFGISTFFLLLIHSL